MADAMYTWTDIQAGKGDTVELIPAGTKVTADKLGLDEMGFQQLVDSGSIRSYPYPEIPKTANPPSPVDFIRSEVMKDVKAEEEQLIAQANPDLQRAQQGPVGDVRVVPEGTEEGEGPKKDK